MNERASTAGSRWRNRWEEALSACSKLGGDARPLIVREPVGETRVTEVERRIGVDLPASFRRVLLEFSSEVEFSWFAPDGHDFPKPFNQIFCGGCSWSLNALPEIQESVQGWIAQVFPNPNDAYDRVWHDKLGFLKVGNGDVLAFDLGPASRGAVVYLSHDDGEGHGCRLGSDFEDFITRWSELGCPGAEDWQWLPFVKEPQGPIDPDGIRAAQWR